MYTNWENQDYFVSSNDIGAITAVDATTLSVILVVHL